MVREVSHARLYESPGFPVVRRRAPLGISTSANTDTHRAAPSPSFPKRLSFAPTATTNENLPAIARHQPGSEPRKTGKPRRRKPSLPSSASSSSLALVGRKRQSHPPTAAAAAAAGLLASSAADPRSFASVTSTMAFAPAVLDRRASRLLTPAASQEPLGSSSSSASLSQGVDARENLNGRPTTESMTAVAEQKQQPHPHRLPSPPASQPIQYEQEEEDLAPVLKPTQLVAAPFPPSTPDRSLSRSTSSRRKHQKIASPASTYNTFPVRYGRDPSLPAQDPASPRASTLLRRGAGAPAPSPLKIALARSRKRSISGAAGPTNSSLFASAPAQAQARAVAAVPSPNPRARKQTRLGAVGSSSITASSSGSGSSSLGELASSNKMTRAGAAAAAASALRKSQRQEQQQRTSSPRPASTTRSKGLSASQGPSRPTSTSKTTTARRKSAPTAGGLSKSQRSRQSRRSFATSYSRSPPAGIPHGTETSPDTPPPPRSPGDDPILLKGKERRPKVHVPEEGDESMLMGTEDGDELDFTEKGKERTSSIGVTAPMGGQRLSLGHAAADDEDEDEDEAHISYMPQASPTRRRTSDVLTAKTTATRSLQLSDLATPNLLTRTLASSALRAAAAAASATAGSTTPRDTVPTAAGRSTSAPRLAFLQPSQLLLTPSLLTSSSRLNTSATAPSTTGSSSSLPRPGLPPLLASTPATITTQAAPAPYTPAPALSPYVFTQPGTPESYSGSEDEREGQTAAVAAARRAEREDSVFGRPSLTRDGGEQEEAGWSDYEGIPMDWGGNDEADVAGWAAKMRSSLEPDSEDEPEEEMNGEGAEEPQLDAPVVEEDSQVRSSSPAEPHYSRSPSPVTDTFSALYGAHPPSPPATQDPQPPQSQPQPSPPPEIELEIDPPTAPAIVELAKAEEVETKSVVSSPEAAPRRQTPTPMSTPQPQPQPQPATTFAVSPLETRAIPHSSPRTQENSVEHQEQEEEGEDEDEEEDGRADFSTTAPPSKMTTEDAQEAATTTAAESSEGEDEDEDEEEDTSAMDTTHRSLADELADADRSMRSTVDIGGDEEKADGGGDQEEEEEEEDDEEDDEEDEAVESSRSELSEGEIVERLRLEMEWRARESEEGEEEDDEEQWQDEMDEGDQEEEQEEMDEEEDEETTRNESTLDQDDLMADYSFAGAHFSTPSKPSASSSFSTSSPMVVILEGRPGGSPSKAASSTPARFRPRTSLVSLDFSSPAQEPASPLCDSPSRTLDYIVDLNDIEDEDEDVVEEEEDDLNPTKHSPMQEEKLQSQSSSSSSRPTSGPRRLSALALSSFDDQLFKARPGSSPSLSPSVSTFGGGLLLPTFSPSVAPLQPPAGLSTLSSSVSMVGGGRRPSIDSSASFASSRDILSRALERRISSQSGGDGASTSKHQQPATTTSTLMMGSSSRPTMTITGDDEDDDNDSVLEETYIKISSNDPREAARATAFLKMFHEYTEAESAAGPNTSIVSFASERASSSRRFSSVAGDKSRRSSFFDGDISMMSTADLLMEAEQDIAVEQEEVAGADAMMEQEKEDVDDGVALDELPIPGSFVRSGSATSMHAPHDSQSKGKGKAKAAAVVNRSTRDRSWGAADWRCLMSCLDAEGGRKDGVRAEDIEEVVVVRFLSEMKLAKEDLDGEWSLPKLYSRIASILQRRANERVAVSHNASFTSTSSASRRRRSHYPHKALLSPLKASSATLSPHLSAAKTPNEGFRKRGAPRPSLTGKILGFLSGGWLSGKGGGAEPPAIPAFAPAPSAPSPAPAPIRAPPTKEAAPSRSAAPITTPQPAISAVPSRLSTGGSTSLPPLPQGVFAHPSPARLGNGHIPSSRRPATAATPSPPIIIALPPSSPSATSVTSSSSLSRSASARQQSSITAPIAIPQPLMRPRTNSFVRPRQSYARSPPRVLELARSFESASALEHEEAERVRELKHKGSQGSLRSGGGARS